MWKRDEPIRPSDLESVGTEGEVTRAAAVSSGFRAVGDGTRSNEREVVNVGKSVVIKGELNGSEDLTIEGQVDGKIELRQHVLTIGPNGKIKAQVFAKSVIVLGTVTGNITAMEKVNIRENGSVDGDVTAPRVAISEGAHFRGSIDMQRQGAAAPKVAGEGKPSTRTSVAAAPAAARSN